MDKYNALSSNTMHTREKFGTLCKRCLKYFYDNKLEVISLLKIIQIMQNFTSDMKKIFDLVFILEGIGLITRISKNSLIYTGFRGMSAKLNEAILKISEKKTSQIFDYLFFSDEILIEEKKYVFRSSLYVGLLVSDIICAILLDSSEFFAFFPFFTKFPKKLAKTLSRNEIEIKLEAYSSQCKELSSKSLINDLVNLLVSLNFVEKNEQVEKITWIGPDCINPSGITKDHLHLLTNLDQLLKFNPQDVVNKENAYFLSLFKEIEDKKEKKENLVKIKQNSLKDAQNQANPAEKHPVSPNKSQDFGENKRNFSENNPLPLHVSKFPEKSFAILKAKNWKYSIKKLQIIIGRSNLHKDCQKKKQFKWIVDVELNNARKISRQHAAILYNFIDKTFEIKCLSKKYPIKIDGNLIGYRDKAFPLYEKSLITIGSEVFYFLPATIRNLEENEKKKEETGNILKEEPEKLMKIEANP